jgi:hypothetical protein
MPDEEIPAPEQKEEKPMNSKRSTKPQNRIMWTIFMTFVAASIMTSTATTKLTSPSLCSGEQSPAKVWPMTATNPFARRSPEVIDFHPPNNRSSEKEMEKMRDPDVNLPIFDRPKTSIVQSNGGLLRIESVSEIFSRSKFENEFHHKEFASNVREFLLLIEKLTRGDSQHLSVIKNISNQVETSRHHPFK